MGDNRGGVVILGNPEQQTPCILWREATRQSTGVCLRDAPTVRAAVCFPLGVRVAEKVCGLPRAFGPCNDESLEVWNISVGAGSVMARKEARNVPTLVIASEARQSIGLHLRDVLPVRAAACFALSHAIALGFRHFCLQLVKKDDSSGKRASITRFFGNFFDPETQ
ncbi:MAG: hypothetical protein LBO00_06720 [Zoogloeaceae bacterium]|jgi:hypothetical protein|nr:hypothetical protein [Zoogloeaceae bacterium]